MAGYTNQASLEPGRSFNRYSIRVNNDLRINDKLNANVDLGLSQERLLNPNAHRGFAGAPVAGYL
jgi:hypothetical protein